MKHGISYKFEGFHDRRKEFRRFLISIDPKKKKKISNAKRKTKWIRIKEVRRFLIRKEKQNGFVRS